MTRLWALVPFASSPDGSFVTWVEVDPTTGRVDPHSVHVGTWPPGRAWAIAHIPNTDAARAFLEAVPPGTPLGVLMATAEEIP